MREYVTAYTFLCTSCLRCTVSETRFAIIVYLSKLERVVRAGGGAAARRARARAQSYTVHDISHARGTARQRTHGRIADHMGHQMHRPTLTRERITGHSGQRCAVRGPSIKTLIESVTAHAASPRTTHSHLHSHLFNLSSFASIRSSRS